MTKPKFTEYTLTLDFAKSKKNHSTEDIDAQITTPHFYDFDHFFDQHKDEFIKKIKHHILQKNDLFDYFYMLTGNYSIVAHSTDISYDFKFEYNNELWNKMAFNNFNTYRNQIIHQGSLMHGYAFNTKNLIRPKNHRYLNDQLIKLRHAEPIFDNHLLTILNAPYRVICLTTDFDLVNNYYPAFLTGKVNADDTLKHLYRCALFVTPDLSGYYFALPVNDVEGNRFSNFKVGELDYLFDNQITRKGDYPINLTLGNFVNDRYDYLNYGLLSNAKYISSSDTCEIEYELNRNTLLQSDALNKFSSYLRDFVLDYLRSHAQIKTYSNGLFYIGFDTNISLFWRFRGYKLGLIDSADISRLYQNGKHIFYTKIIPKYDYIAGHFLDEDKSFHRIPFSMNLIEKQLTLNNFTNASIQNFNFNNDVTNTINYQNISPDTSMDFLYKILNQSQKHYWFIDDHALVSMISDTNDNRLSKVVESRLIDE